ncbi:folate family ECF transporter S component [Ligaoa zhengdingensis]|uniref:folate family ECF transporter S component n=1 Tax=Ligaoa zhengdingensis TaxID=2763658 RepID=UPI0031BB75C2
MLFSTPFSLAYWRAACGELKSLRMLALAALFVGIRVVISTFFIPVGENLRIYFSFFETALCGLVCGPVIGVMAGFVGDLVGFFVHPFGGFFFGYTVTAMVSGLIYGLAFYRTRITALKVFLCKLSINLLVNVGLGALWSAMLYGKGYYYYLAKSLVKNLLLLPIETVLLVLFFQLMLPVLARAHLGAPQPTKRIPLF